MSRPAYLALPLIIASVVLAASGCGKTVIDSAKAEAFIKDGIEKNSPATISSVDCPDDVEVEANKTFECTATSDQGKKATITLKILNDNADVRVIDFQTN